MDKIDKNFILTFISKNKCNYHRILKCQYGEFYNEINNKFIGFTFSEKLYRWLNDDIENIGICKQCNSNKTKFDNIFYGFRDYCSSKCSNSCSITKDKKEKSYIKKYGNTNPSKIESVKQKKRETMR